jgi:hypothetical protein
MAAGRRAQIVANAIQARRPPVSGGTTAPRSAAGGATTGIGQNRRAPGGGKLGGGIAKPPGAPAGAPAPAVATGPTPTPWSSKYEQTVAGANKKYLDASGNFDLQEQTAKQDFGLDPGFNDYQSNPNSRAALLEQSFLTNNRGTMNSAGNQLYSGSTSNRLAANRTNYGTSRDSLAKSYRDALGEVSTGRAKAKETQDEEAREAYWNSVGEAEKSEPEAEAAPAAAGKGKGGGKGKGKSRGQATYKAIAANPWRNKAPAGKPKGKGGKGR